MAYHGLLFRATQGHRLYYYLESSVGVWLDWTGLVFA